MSVSDGFPHQFRHVHDEVGLVALDDGRTDLTHAHAHHVVQTAVPVAVTEVQDRADDLPQLSG
jgi:hypothetical protein